MNSSRGHSGISFQQTISSCSVEAESLCLKIREVLQENDLSPFCFPVELLAREGLANAAAHGNRNDPAKSIALHLSVGREWIHLQIADEGPGFAWRKMVQRKIDPRWASGRGLQLYAIYADRIQFNRRGNRISFWIRKNKQTGNGDC